MTRDADGIYFPVILVNAKQGDSVADRQKNTPKSPRIRVGPMLSTTARAVLMLWLIPGRKLFYDFFR